MNLEAKLEEAASVVHSTTAGAKIDHMLLHFDLHMRERLVPAMARDEMLDVAITAAIRQCFEEEEYEVFQWETLGVYGGAFGLSHNSRKNFVLFQNASVETGDIKGVRLPYLPRDTDSQDYEELIDALFLGRRGKQPLMGGGDNSFSPEFYWQLAQTYYDEYHRFESSSFTQYLKQKFSPYVYCPIGEVAFFLYSWRLLVRHLQESGDLTDPISHNLSFSSGSSTICSDIWRQEVWEDQVGFCPEREWILTIERLISSEVTQEFRERVRSQWTNWRRRLDFDPDQPLSISESWRMDWFSLGLLTENSPSGARPTRTLLSLLKFAADIYKGHSLVFGQIENVVAESIRDESSVSWEELEKLDLMLQNSAIWFLRKRLNGFRSISSLISELHGLARFPLLPYFYWTAVDGLPKEHFVFPIWESWRFPVEVSVPERQGGKSVFTVPAVGIGLIALRPMDEMGLPEFDPCDPERRLFSHAHSRLFRTERVFLRIVRPMVDAAFYGILIRDAAHSEGRAEQIESWAHALQTKLALLQQLYDRLTAESGGGEALTVNLESWRNIGGSLRSLRRTITALAYYRRVKEYLEAKSKTLLTLAEGEEVDFRQLNNRSLGHVLLDAFHLMAAKVSLGEEKYGDLAERMKQFKQSCEHSNLPPLSMENGQETHVTFERINEFFPKDKSVRFDVVLPAKTSLSNFEVWKRVSINPKKEPLVFFYDAILGVVIDEILSNALKHVDAVDDESKISIELTVEDSHNTAHPEVTWAALKVTNTAAFGGLRDEIPASRSLLDQRDSGLGLFFNRELSRTLTGDFANYEVKIDPEFRKVESIFRFPVVYRRTLSKRI